MSKLRTSCSLAVLAVALTSYPAVAGKILVTEANYKNAESDLAFKNITNIVGSNKWFHFPGLAPLDNQTVVSMNRDTIYSGYTADLSRGGTVTIPKTDGRYLSVMIVQNDHYIDQGFTTPGTHQIKAKTNFVMIVARMQINPNDPKDMQNVKRFQSQIVVTNGSKRDHVMPDYDLKQLEALRAKLVKEGSKIGSLNNMQGARGTVDERMHLLGTALGWGLLPDANAQYHSFFSKGKMANPNTCSKSTYVQPPMNDGGFFSTTMYGADSFVKNKKSILNRYNRKLNTDQTFTLYFGKCSLRSGKPFADNQRLEIPVPGLRTKS